MKYHRPVIWMVFIWMWMVPLTVLAENSCPNIVESALKAVDQACSATGRNQACYGNIQLDAQMQPGVSDLAFKQQGDIADITKIKTIRLSALNAQTDEWGVALMKIQANLPDTLPGQNVAMLLFGDVEITDARESQPPSNFLDVTVASSANMMAEPTDTAALLSNLSTGQTLKAGGRNEAGDWLQIQLDGGEIGWVAAQFVTVSGDPMSLPVIDTTSTQPVENGSRFGPMQSFYLKTGIGDAPCAEAPDSGILIQTPSEAGQIELSVNGAEISLGSTGYFQAQPNGEMTISIVEGQGTVTSQNVTRTVPAGSRVRVPLDANLIASSPPSNPEPYDNADLAMLPVSHMPSPIVVANALTQAQLDALSSAAILPVSGDWVMVYTSYSLTDASCNDPNDFGTKWYPDHAPRDRPFPLNLTVPFSLIDIFVARNPYVDASVFDSAVVQNPEPNLYIADGTTADSGDGFSNVWHEELRFTSPTQGEGTINETGTTPFGTCVLAETYTLTAQ